MIRTGRKRNMNMTATAGAFTLATAVFFSILAMSTPWCESADTMGTTGERQHTPGHEDHGGESDIAFWTCPMHPHIKLPEPGRCPICQMELVPVEKVPMQKGGPTLELSESARKLAEIETTRVERRLVEKKLRLVGRVDFDETRLKYITAWVPGRIDRLFVDYTGITVRKGDHMVEIYSSDLLSTQEELLQAAKTLERLTESGSPLVKKSTERAVEAARERLLLWGLTPSQVRAIETRGTPQDRITIYAPIGGIVIEKNAAEGMYVQTGTRIYVIADLAKVWIQFDAYESDLPWIRYGQEVEFTTRALPGEVFKGRISFIRPFLDKNSRTTMVRLTADNSKGILKPGLFVTGVVRATVFGKGKVIDTSMAGKWIGPMHPEIVSDYPGKCPICGMDLEKAEDLGYVTAAQDVTPPLVIAASAPLITGERAVVYVKNPDAPVYELRDVVLGPRAGDYYIVEGGLHDGEEVVTNGAFKIDSDLQIKGMRSMMNPEGGRAMEGHAGHGGH